MTPPPAVAPAAPVSVPQSAAPPGGSSPPSGSPPTGGLFGEILDSARTAVAEGHKETGKNAGDQSSGAKSSSTSAKQSSSQTTSGADLIAAAVAFLTGQTPVEK